MAFYYYYLFSIAENFIDSLLSLFPSKMSVFFLHSEDICSEWSSGLAPWAESCQQAQSAATQTRPPSKLATCLRKLSQGEPLSEKNVSSFPHYFHHPYFYGGALLAQCLFLSHTNQLQSLGSAKNGLFIFIRALVRISALIKRNMCLMSLFTF